MQTINGKGYLIVPIRGSVEVPVISVPAMRNIAVGILA